MSDTLKSIIGADEALNSFKYGKNGGTILPLSFVVACSGKQPGKLHNADLAHDPRLIFSAYKVENVSVSGRHKLRRKKACANLRADRAVLSILSNSKKLCSIRLCPLRVSKDTSLLFYVGFFVISLSSLKIVAVSFLL